MTTGILKREEVKGERILMRSEVQWHLLGNKFQSTRQGCYPCSRCRRRGTFLLQLPPSFWSSIFKTKLPSNIQNHKKGFNNMLKGLSIPIQKQQVNLMYLWVNIQNQKLLLKKLGLVPFLLHLPSYLPLPHTEQAVQPHVLAFRVRSCLGELWVRINAPHFHFVM